MTRNTLESALSEFKPSDFLNVMKIRESVIVGAPKERPKNCKGGWKSNDVIRQSKRTLQREEVAQFPCGMVSLKPISCTYKETAIASDAFQQVWLTRTEQAVFLLIYMDT